MFTIDSDLDAAPVTASMATSVWRHGEVVAFRADMRDGVVSDGVARAIAADWQSPSPLDEHTTRLAGGLPYRTQDLLDEIERHRALARESILGAEYITAVGELDLLIAWALQRRS